jgi:hypothetical protein
MLPPPAAAPTYPRISTASSGLLAGESTTGSGSPPVPESPEKSLAFRPQDAAKNPLPVSDAPGAAVLSHSAPALSARRSAGLGAAEAINTEPDMIADGVFVGEGRAKSGEKIFLKMERVTDANRTPWERYCQSTAQLTRHGRSVLTFAMRGTKAIQDENGATRYVNEQYEALADRLGQSREEFDDFINLLGRNGYAWSQENKRRINAIHNTHAGATHLCLSTEAECYVIYASKTQDFQMPRIGDNSALSEPLTLREYARLYRDLLICVGMDFPDRDSIHSKGMFRNPISSIARTHSGLSMILRGFSGAVVQKYFPEKQTLCCRPLSSMQYMISSSLQPDDYHVVDYSHEEALTTAEESIREGQIFEMPMNTIKVSALDRLYRNHASA